MKKTAAFLSLALLIVARPAWAQVSDELIEKVKPAIVALYADNDLKNLRGSGFIFDAQGNILTNYHVCEKCPRLWAKFLDGRRFELTRVFIWPDNDMAIWRPLPASLGNQSAFLYLRLNDSSYLMPGAALAAIGHTKDFQNKDNPNKDLLWQLIRGEFKEKYFYLRYQPTILYGFSGSPLINENGYVVGLNAGSDSRYVSIIKDKFYTYAITLDDIKEFLDYFYGRKTVAKPELPVMKDVLANKCIWRVTEEGRWCRH